MMHHPAAPGEGRPVRGTAEGETEAEADTEDDGDDVTSRGNSHCVMRRS